jgi:hypothetical protein
MNRIIAALAALSLAPAALAQAQENPQQAAQTAPAESGPDLATLEGKIDALAEQYAETKNDVSALKRLKLSGYLQARWAWLEAPGAVTPYTNNAAPAKDNFYIRRGRLKAVYDADWSQYVLQIDATPDGVGIKEGYAEVKLPAGLAVDAGLQLFPFGYEVGVRSSADLDLLERAKLSTTFLNGEYDLGVALRGVYGPMNFKVGVFNGNGIAGNGVGRDNDQLKDVIGRLGFDLGHVTGGVSGWYGKTINYRAAGNPRYDRSRVGADLQVFLDLLPIGGTAVKGEWIWGKTQIGDTNPTDNGAGTNLGKAGMGWYALATQNVGPWNQLAVRYQQFTPVQGATPSATTKVTTTQEIAGAFHTFIGDGYKLSLAYYHPTNRTRFAGTPADPKADQWIVQAQAKF